MWCALLVLKSLAGPDDRLVCSIYPTKSSGLWPAGYLPVLGEYQYLCVTQHFCLINGTWKMVLSVYLIDEHFFMFYKVLSILLLYLMLLLIYWKYDKNLKIAGTRPIIIKKVTKSKGKKNIFVKINVFPLTTWSKVWENRLCVTI